MFGAGRRARSARMRLEPMNVQRRRVGQMGSLRARIVGGALAWVVSLAPLVVVNLIAYVGLFTPDVAALIGAVALVTGVALGALTAGLMGGRAPDLGVTVADGAARPPSPTPQRPAYAPGVSITQGRQSEVTPRLGARGALASGGIAATLYALTMGGLIQLANSLNILPNIVTQHPIRITAAILCVAAIFVSLAMLVGWWVARGATADDLDAELAPVGGRMGGALSAPLGATPTMRGPVAASRPHTPPSPARSAAPATRPLSSAEIGGSTPYGGQSGYGGQGGYGVYARPSQTASRPRAQSDQRYSAPPPANSPYNPYPARDSHDSYDSYRQDDRYRDDRQYAQQRQGYDGRDGYYDDYDDDDDRYSERSGERADRRAKRGSQRRYDADDRYDEDDDEADDRWSGDDRRRDSRAGVRRPAHGAERYEE